MLNDYYQILNRITKEKLTEWAADIVQTLKQNHIDAGQVASGETLKQFGFDVKDGQGSIIVYIKGASHIEYLDRGRGDGGVSPVSKIESWIKAKNLQSKFNISNAKQLNRVALAIAWKHAREGSYQHRTGQTFKGVKNPVSAAFSDLKISQLNSRLGAAVLPLLKSEILEQFKVKA